MLVPFLALLGISAGQGQIVVRVRPVAPVVVARPVAPSPRHVWVAEEWGTIRWYICLQSWLLAASAAPRCCLDTWSLEASAPWLWLGTGPLALLIKVKHT